MKKSLLFTIVALLVSMTTNAAPVKFNGLWYNLNRENHTAEVCSSQDGTSYLGDIVIPETVTSSSEPYTITRIGDWAFSECRSLTSVVIPETVTSIGEGAFRCCSNLVSINQVDGVNHLPNGITDIGWVALEGCGITSITIPTSLSYIDGRVFCNCPLTSIYIPETITSIDFSAFSRCSNLTSRSDH